MRCWVAPAIRVWTAHLKINRLPSHAMLKGYHCSCYSVKCSPPIPAYTQLRSLSKLPASACWDRSAIAARAAFGRPRLSSAAARRLTAANSTSLPLSSLCSLHATASAASVQLILFSNTQTRLTLARQLHKLQGGRASCLVKRDSVFDHGPVQHALQQASKLHSQQGCCGLPCLLQTALSSPSRWMACCKAVGNSKQRSQHRRCHTTCCACCKLDSNAPIVQPVVARGSDMPSPAACAAGDTASTRHYLRIMPCLLRGEERRPSCPVGNGR